MCRGMDLFEIEWWLKSWTVQAEPIDIEGIDDRLKQLSLKKKRNNLKKLYKKN